MRSIVDATQPLKFPRGQRLPVFAWAAQDVPVEDEAVATELLEKLGDINFELIFTTSYDQYAIKAIRFSALDYLLKPVDREELQKAVQKSAQRNQHPLSQQLDMLMQKLKRPAVPVNKIAIPTMEGFQLLAADSLSSRNATSGRVEMRDRHAGAPPNRGSNSPCEHRGCRPASPRAFNSVNGSCSSLALTSTNVYVEVTVVFWPRVSDALARASGGAVHRTGVSFTGAFRLCDGNAVCNLDSLRWGSLRRRTQCPLPKI